MIFFGFSLGLSLCLLFAFSRSWFAVAQGYVGVLTSFGAAEINKDGAGLALYAPGVYRKWPWQRAIAVSMKEQHIELSGERHGQQAMAHDGTVLRFDSILRYVPQKEHLAQFLFGMRNPIEHITGLFSCLLRNEIANFGSVAKPASDELGSDEVGSYALIRRERRLLNQRIEDFCRDRIGAHYGVGFHAVDLVDILPPDELAEALNAVMQARSAAEAAYFDAEGECQQRVLAAREGVEIATIRAAASRTEIEKLGEYLERLQQSGALDAYVARRRAEVLSESRTTFFKESFSKETA